MQEMQSNGRLTGDFAGRITRTKKMYNNAGNATTNKIIKCSTIMQKQMEDTKKQINKGLNGALAHTDALDKQRGR